MSRIAPGTDLLDGAVALVDALPQPRDVPAASDEDVISLLRAIEAVGRRVDALRAALAGEVAVRSRRELGHEGLAARMGCRNAVELVRRATKASTTSVNRRIRLGTATRWSVGLTGEQVPPPFEHVAGALETLGTDGALAIVDTLGPARRVAGFEAVAVAEAEIVRSVAGSGAASAVPSDADCLRVQATAWRAVLDPDGAAPDERDEERRGVRFLAPRHGLVPVSGMLLPDVAAALQRYADACTNPRTAERAAPARAGDALPDAAQGADDTETASGSVPVHAPDPRSRAQRLHDVLATVVGVAARQADAPSIAGNAPTLMVSVRAEDLIAGTGTASADGGAAPLSIAAARQVACAGTIERVVLSAQGRITRLGAPDRCFTGSQRRAIAVRDGGCVIPGCHVPAGWCEVHHVVPHAHDPGGTHTDNGVLLCWFHHRTLDRSGWQVRMAGGVPEVRAPRWLDPTGTWHPAAVPRPHRRDAGASGPVPR